MLVSTISTPSRSLASTLVKTGAALETRRRLATPSSPHASTSSSSPSTSSSSRRRSARFASRPGADMVGPPDPISNLRPVRYGSAFDSTSSASSSSSTSPSSALTMSHPYSLHEFTTPSTSTSTPSLYFERLLTKLEEAELAHKLRMARADNFNQRFWQDNNARFIDALSEFRSRTSDSKAVATTGKASKEQAKESELDLDSDSLATFYSAWLKANAKRHRAYNRQLWYQTFEDLAPAARYQGLRAWAKVVGGWERWFGRR